MKTPYAYYGGKSRMAELLVGCMPPHTTYVEPFFGSGAVFFAVAGVASTLIVVGILGFVLMLGGAYLVVRSLRAQPADVLGEIGQRLTQRGEFVVQPRAGDRQVRDDPLVDGHGSMPRVGRRATARRGARERGEERDDAREVRRGPGHRAPRARS